MTSVTPARTEPTTGVPSLRQDRPACWTPTTCWPGWAAAPAVWQKMGRPDGWASRAPTRSVRTGSGRCPYWCANCARRCWFCWPSRPSPRPSPARPPMRRSSASSWPPRSSRGSADLLARLASRPRTSEYTRSGRRRWRCPVGRWARAPARRACSRRRPAGGPQMAGAVV